MKNWCRAAAYVVCLDEVGRLLLTQFAQEGNPDSGAWALPGGGMEWGESMTDTVVREVMEETGLTVTLGSPVAVHSMWFDAETSIHRRPGQALGLIFRATNPVGVLRTTFDPADTTVGAGWYSVTEAQNLRTTPLVDCALETLESQDFVAVRHIENRPAETIL